MHEQSTALGSYASDAHRSLRATATRYAAAIQWEIHSDRLLYAFMGFYVLAIWLASLLIGDSSKFRPLLYVSPTLSMSASSLLLILTPPAAVAVAVAIQRNPTAPFSELLRIVRSVVGPRVITGTLLLTMIGVFYGAFTSAKNMLPDAFHNHWDTSLAKADRLISGGIDPSAILMAIQGNNLTLLGLVYGGAWHVLVFGLTALIAVSRSHDYVRKRFLLATLMCWVFVGNILAATFYSGGPSFYDLFTGDSSRFSELTKSIPAVTLAEQSYLRAFFKTGEMGIGSGISAFPSMHVTAATLVCFLLRSINRRLSWLGIAFVALIEIGSIRLGWHYAIDGYVGICSAAIAWWVAGKINAHNPRARAV